MGKKIVFLARALSIHPLNTRRGISLAV